MRVIDSNLLAELALQLLHQYGWVHRDVSCGNLLVFDGGGKLSDLEYTKKMSQESTHEIRTVCYGLT
jgi:serine/threonine protein kinase